MSREHNIPKASFLASCTILSNFYVNKIALTLWFIFFFLIYFFLYFFADFDKLNTEISEVQINLKPKVAKLRDIEEKDELKGFDLQPLSKTELQAVSDLL